MHWQVSQICCRIRRPGVALAVALILSPNICLAQNHKANQNNIAVVSPTLKKMVPIADKPQQAAEPAKPTRPTTQTQPAAPPKDEYPTLARMENITFGHANSGLSLDTRLNYLEATIFRQSFSQLSPNQRAAKLQETLFGQVEDSHFPGAPPAAKNPHPSNTTHEAPMEPSNTERAMEESQEPTDRVAENQPFYQAKISFDELKIFVLQMINDRRNMEGLPSLTADETAGKVAQVHAEEMAKRNAISHFDAKGENPDQRYTKAGGSDSMTECLTMLTNHGQINRMTGIAFLRDLLKKQDDHDAIMSADATGLGFAAAENHSSNRAYACFELVNKHGIMQPVPTELKAGEKIEVKGAVFEPYRIDRVTLAWENPNPDALASADESEEALPYFPPLDYVAYAAKSDRDWTTGINMLKAAGFVACLAGSAFIPPVALAAPAFTMMGNSNAEPKPASDIPVKGGVKVAGPLFNVKIGISNDSKPGLYYLTVWAIPEGGSKAVPISRRTIVATSEHKEDKHDDEKLKGNKGNNDHKNQ